ncbi:MAG TPA: M61 family peptidase [Candidatus Methylomirabilis sp.]|nr:M61 family peptidase [Candidatus Methylomirabilis sp.]
MKLLRFFTSLSLLFALSLSGARPAPAQSSSAIRLTVDARQAPLKILRVHLEIPVSSGPLTLYYPKWVPGLHEPAGPMASVTGLIFTASGKTIPWRRDLRDVFTFHLDIPQGTTQLDASFDYLEPSGPGGPAAGSATAKLLVLNWNQVVLYPAGAPAAKILFQPKILLPDGWKFATALPGPSANSSGSQVSFAAAALDLLVDSTFIAGEYFRAIDLTPPGEPIHHEIDLVADSEAALAMPPEVQRGLTNLVAEAGRLFGARHYREYHFLLTLSDHMPHFGIEHHQSNDSRLPERILLSPNSAREVGGLLAHEYAHSWSGKFRRPQDLATPDFQTPMETDLLWVYEGNTSYFGDLLAARSGLWKPEDYREALAGIAASLGPGRPGRTWRPLLDTAVAIPGMFFGGGWADWRRGSDYYEEGELIWLEVANIIHDQSHGQKSFDDFARLFYGGSNNGPEVKPYTFDQLVQAFNQVVPYDWAKLFRARLDSTSRDAPIGGIESSGWKLVYDDKPSAGRGSRGGPGAAYSLGLTLGSDGTVQDSIYGSPAFQAGITSGMKILGINGRVFTPDLLPDVLKASKDSQQTIQFLVVSDDYYKTCTVAYRGGERYPHLVRDDSKPDYLADLLKPLSTQE